MCWGHTDSHLPHFIHSDANFIAMMLQKFLDLLFQILLLLFLVDLLTFRLLLAPLLLVSMFSCCFITFFWFFHVLSFLKSNSTYQNHQRILFFLLLNMQSLFLLFSSLILSLRVKSKSMFFAISMEKRLVFLLIFLYCKLLKFCYVINFSCKIWVIFSFFF